MGERNKLILRYLSASEEDKNEARRLAWGACGSWERFYKTLQNMARRGWVTAGSEITESGRQRLARYPDEPGPTSPPVIVRGELADQRWLDAIEFLEREHPTIGEHG